MAKRKKNRKKKSFTIPVALVAGVTAPFVMPVPPAGESILDSVLAGDFQKAGENFYHQFTGINNMGVFSLQNLFNNYKPIIAGVGIHYAASKLGINRRIAAAGIPVFRI